MGKILSLVALFVVSILTLSMVSALDNTKVDFGSIKVNGEYIGDDEVLAVEEGQKLDVKIGLKALTTVEDVEVEAEIKGYEYSDYENLEDSTHLFDIAAGTTKYVTLSLNLPDKLDKDSYLLRIRVLDKNTAALTKDITLAIEPARHGLTISDIAFAPGNTVKAGKSLLTTVLLKNYGDKEEKDAKVTVSIPALGVSATEFVDSLPTDDNNVEYEDVPEMFLPIPATAAAGEYEVKVTVSYDGYETASKAYKINILANEMYQNQDKLVLAVGPESQVVAAGTKATYGIALTNAGAVSKAFILEAVTGDWASASLSDSLVVLEPGKNKVVYVDVNVAENAVAGEHLVSVAVKSGKEVLQNVVLKANVVPAPVAPATSYSLRNGLEIALIILVVVLVIIGLIIGFSRMRKDDEEEEKTYY